VFESQGIEVALAAPTGRAAKRMSELTGREAQTIHRLLEVEWDRNDRPCFQRNRRNPISAGAVIVDELSMVDVTVFSSLLEALPIGCRLVMVGDSDQLPPVGAGNVLHDMINSKALPVVELNEVFRQAMESLIVTNAHSIVRGEYPDLSRTDKDFFFMQRGSVASTAETVTDLYCNRLPKAYGYNAMDDIQIICPSKKGESGTVSLNRKLQEMLNPPSKDKESYQSGVRIFREGDKVMQIKNNYDIIWKKGKETSAGIFNGDIGRIKIINHNAGFMKIDFDGREALYPFDNIAELELAYAITVHKSQGSEYPIVIIPMYSCPPMLMTRNLLYTAVTRAKSMVIMVGRADMVMKMVENKHEILRYTTLEHRLKECHNN
jgi:exodeoxyribonuclease V alpha subunit